MFIALARMSAAAFKEEWMAHPEWWMKPSAKDDEYIVATYGHLLDDTTGHDSIIVYDQLPRHVFRNDAGAAHVITYFLQKALALVPDDITARSLSTAEWIFAMLPIRHSEDIIAIHNVVLPEAWRRLEKDQDDQLLRRFLKATYERMPVSGESREYYCRDAKGRCIDYKRHIDVLDFIPDRRPCTHVNYKDIVAVGADERYILSLSGGVDSMVASVLFKDNIEAAVHINYMNRGAASIAEEAFVREWCVFLGIPLYVRRIPEFIRDAAMKHGLREVYESYTKRVRMAAYKDAGDFPVILGHNADDAFENIMTNIAQEQKYENLTGMSKLSTQDGITFYRPLLDIAKARIYEIAHENNIPYVHNSTPSWSQRGQIRDSVRPTLEKWDKRFVDGAFSLAGHFADMSRMTKAYVATCVARTVDGCELIVEKEELGAMNNVSFWREYIVSLTGIAPSMKALRQLCDRCARLKEGKTMVPVHKDVGIELRIKKATMQITTHSYHLSSPSR